MVLDSNNSHFGETGEVVLMFKISKPIFDCPGLINIPIFLTSYKDQPVIPTTTPLHDKQASKTPHHQATCTSPNSPWRSSPLPLSPPRQRRRRTSILPRLPLPSTNPSSSPSHTAKSCRSPRVAAGSNRPRGVSLNVGKRATINLVVGGSRRVMDVVGFGW
jgi:hypothetical protein